MSGAYDLHFHIGPEAIPRRCDALSTARELEAGGMTGAVLKNHYFSTVPFAKMAWDQGAENVWGSLVLNWYVGGLNPFAVRGSLGLKARGQSLFKVLWMPTVHAAAHLRVRAAHGSKYDIPPEWTGGVLSGTPIEQVPPIDLCAPEEIGRAHV